MLFKRKRSRSLFSSIKEAVWPSMGWGRTATYMTLRVNRIDDSARNIALGIALGAAISFSPFVGTHIIQGIILAWVLRANVLGAVLGTVFGNPWTFPFIWLAGISVGSALFSVFGVSVESSLPPEVNLPILWNLLWNDSMRLLAPWMVGGYVLAAASAPIFYVIILPIVKGGKAAARKAKARRMQKTAKDGTIEQSKK